MSPRFVLALSSLLALVMASDASANGRSPGTSTIQFRRGMEQEVVAGMTFGLLRSVDNGATWHWMCEDAIGYGGTYDPDYMYTSSGAVFATTFDGLKVMRDGCTFASPYGRKFVSVTAQGPDGRLYHATSDTPSAGNPGDSNIYRSEDDGVTWPVSSMPGVLNDWWQSLEVAPRSTWATGRAAARCTPRCPAPRSASTNSSSVTIGTTGPSNPSNWPRTPSRS
jgi:hypothetical protein